MAITFELIDHTDECIDAKNAAVDRALEMIGLQAEGYAKMLCPVGTPESTGIEGYSTNGLRQSITHTTEHTNQGDTVIIGTNKTARVTRADGGTELVPYPIYVELGTGIHAENGNGRRTPWIWVDENGKRHKTSGMKPRHFMKKAIADHIDEYKEILETSLKS